ncbi:putative RNA-directed DNA polymerase, partial [Tanacetum coccineum]
MEKNIRNNVKYAGTESEIWSDLNERFGKESAPRAYELKQKIASTRQGALPYQHILPSYGPYGMKLSPYIPSLDVLVTTYHMVAEDERQRAVSNENINPHESAAFKAFQRRNGPLGSNKERSGTKAVKEGIEHCTECNKDGNSKGTRPVANMAHKEEEEGEWIFDSGCTEYITYLSNILVNKKATHFEAPVIIPNGDSIPVKGKGDYKRNLIGAGRCRGGLYRMKIIHGRKAMATTVETWHRRLGHASKGKLVKVDFLKTSINDLGDFCDSCAKAKHTRLPFPSSFIKTSAPFELIHCDIWGGYRVSSYTKANYFLTIVDDFSRAVWLFLLKHKSEASQCLKIFHKMIEVQFEKQIKRVRCDNGGEFTSNDMLEFYNEKGILLETTCPHTPQQNGVVERKHRHLLETTRALRIGANRPKRFWGECILTAAHVIIRLPSK